MTDSELKSWQAEWQTLGAGSDFAEALAKRARRDGRKLRMSALAEIAGVVVSTSICMWLLVRSRGAIEVVAMLAFILIFNGAWLTYFFTLRAGAFSTGGETTEAFVAITRRRFAIDKRWIQFSRRWTYSLLAVVAPWAVWFGHKHAATFIAEPWRAAVGFGGVAIIIGKLFLWLRYRERRMLRSEAAFEDELKRADVAESP